MELSSIVFCFINASKTLMIYKEIPVKHSQLLEIVESYWTLIPNPQSDLHSTKALIVPDGTIGMFLQSNCIYREYEGKLSLFSGSYLFGQKSKPVYYHLTDPNVYCFGVKLKPQGMGKITKVSLSEFTDDFIETAEIFGQAAREMVAQVQEALQIATKIRAFENFLLSHLLEKQTYDQLILEKALSQIHQYKGFLSIKEICKSLNIGYKKLERVFNKKLGISPKIYACIVRFNQAIVTKYRNPEYNLTEIAHASGYFDQMHFIREMKRFSATTPSKYFFKHHHPLESFHQRLIQQRFQLYQC